MTMPFDLEREDLVILLRSYDERRQDKKAEVDRLRQELGTQEQALKALEEKMEKLSRQLDPKSGENKERFPGSGTWHDRIQFVLRLFNRSMTTSEIVTVLEKYMPDWDRKKLMTSVSATVSAAIDTIYTRENEKIWIK